MKLPIFQPKKTKNKKPSIRSKLHKIIIIPAIFTFIIVLGLIILSYNIVNNEILQHQQTLITSLSQNTEQFLNETEKIMSTVAYSLQDYNESNQQNILSNTRNYYPRFSAIYLTDENGTVILENTSSKSLLHLDISGEKFFDEALNIKSPYFSNPFISQSSQLISITCIIPIIDNDNSFAGSFVGEMNLDSLQNRIEKINIGENIVTFIVDQRGNLIAHPNQQWVQEQRNMADLKIIQDGLSGKNSLITSFEDNQNNWVIGSTSVMDNGWVVVTTQPVFQIYQSVFLLVLFSIMILLLIIVMFFLLNRLSYQGITKPVSRLVELANSLAKNEYHTALNKDAGQFREISSLEESFNQMADKIQERNQSLNETIGKLKQSYNDLEKNEEKFRTMIDFTNDWEEWSDPHGNLIYVSPNFKQITGYSVEEFCQNPGILKKIIAPNDQNLYFNHLKQVSSEHDKTHNLDFRIITKDGKERWIGHKCQPVYNNQGTYLGIRSSNRDITNQKHIEMKLTQANKKIHKLNVELEQKVKDRTSEIERLLKHKDEFIHQLGHDLKNPIGPLINLLPVLKTHVNSEDDRQIIEVLERNVRYMKNLVQKTIELATLRSPYTEFQIEHTNLLDLSFHVIEKNDLLFRENNVFIQNNISDDIEVNIDRLRFEELLDNIFCNAVKYKNGDKGSITINAIENTDCIHISIKDDGIGINEHDLNHVFEEFYKVDPSRHDFDSSGLGMPICKRIVEKHGGRIWIESKGEGMGCTVHFTIPKFKHGSSNHNDSE